MVLVVAVGSENPVKVAAVRAVFSRIFSAVNVLAVKVNSGVPPQPFNEDTVRGAVNRAKEALRRCHADFGVGIEAGLFSMPKVKFLKTGFVDVQWCAIADSEGRISLGCGPGFEHPPAVIERVLREGVEIEQAFEALTGEKNIGERAGAVGFLSKNLTNRREITEMCVLMALIPMLNKQWYFSSKRELRSMQEIGRD